MVELPYAFQVHTLVEMDVKFPDQSHYYRCRGLIEWQSPGETEEKPHKLGIRVMSMEKLDPEGFPMTPPKIQRRPAVATARVSKRVESPLPAPGEAPVPEPPPYDPPPAMDYSVPETRTARTTDLKIPKAREVSEILTSLIGEKIEVQKQKDEIDPDDIAVVGAYKDESGRILSLVGTDIALANWLGASLAMIPKEVAKKDIEAQGIAEETKENTQEIFNINASVLNAPDLPHHRFDRLYNCFDDEHPSAVRALMNDPVARIDFTVEVPGYGAGRLCYLFNEWHLGNDAEPPAAGPALDETQYVPPEPEREPEPPAAPPFQDAAPFVPPARPEPSKPPPPEDAGPAYTLNPPKAREIAELFTNLVGDAVGVEKHKGDPLDADDIATIGNFVTDDGQTIALCCMDIKLANWSAAALAMIPKDVAKMDIDNWKLSEELRDNVQEILNIAASIFNKPGMPHLRFDNLIVTMDGDPPAAIRTLLSNPTERVDFTVKIPGYGEGMMACMFKGP